MGFFKKALLYTGIFAAGALVSYKSCNHTPDYRVVREHGELYVEHKRSGMMSPVEEEFSINRRACHDDENRCGREQSISERVEEAVDALFR